MDYLTIGFALIALAVVLAAAELVIPSGGSILVVAAVLDLIGILVVFVYGDVYLGFATLVGQAILLPIFVVLAMYIWPRTPFGRRMIVEGQPTDEKLVAFPGGEELEQLRGRVGKAVSVLRPAGVVEFDGRRVDCLSEGVLIEPNTWVRCIDVKGATVIVRPLENAPDLANFE